jgi:NAD(P)-dependent dehydrogenase (short-subunit alcohol dehydrogenase family)
MKVLITGAAGGIGRAAAERFLSAGHTVAGLDLRDSALCHENYTHIAFDLRRADLPELDGVEILVCCAGVQNSGEDIDVNLKALIRATEQYGVRPGIRSICLVASASGHSGAEFPEYAASKGGVLAYAKNVAQRVAPYGATCNSISPGGVLTDLNRHILDDPTLWDAVMAETPLKKWATPAEIAEWIYFLTAVNRSMTGQDVLVDNGEMINYHFIW